MSSPDETPFERVARPFGLAAGAVLVFMMLLTTVAVLARQLFDHSILGLIELSELALLGVIFIAMPAMFMRDENIVVDVIDHFVPQGVARALYLLGLATTLAFLVATSVAMIEPAAEMYDRRQHTMALEIDRFYHWLPILFGFYLAIAGTFWLLVHRARGGGPPVSPPGAG